MRALVWLGHLVHGWTRSARDLNTLFVTLFRGPGTSLHRVRNLLVERSESITDPDRTNVPRVVRNRR